MSTNTVRDALEAQIAAQRGRRRRFSRAEVAAAIRLSGGYQAVAAKMLSQATGRPCARSTICTYIHQDPELEALMAEVLEANVDNAEFALQKKINTGDTTALIFFLKTKGRSRGYIERQELEHSGETVLRVKLPDGWGEGEFEPGEPVGDGD